MSVCRSVYHKLFSSPDRSWNSRGNNIFNLEITQPQRIESFTGLCWQPLSKLFVERLECSSVVAKNPVSSERQIHGLVNSRYIGLLDRIGHHGWKESAQLDFCRATWPSVFLSFGAKGSWVIGWPSKTSTSLSIVIHKGSANEDHRRRNTSTTATARVILTQIVTIMYVI